MGVEGVEEEIDQGKSAHLCPGPLGVEDTSTEGSKSGEGASGEVDVTVGTAWAEIGYAHRDALAVGRDADVAAAG